MKNSRVRFKSIFYKKWKEIRELNTIALTSLLVLLTFGFRSRSIYHEITTQKRIALVIGMASYKEVDQLPLCNNDADSMATILRKLNFEVFVYKNLSQQEMENAITNWALKLKDYDVGMFYYSGHGAEVQGENYLFPVDAKKTTPAQTKFSTVALGEILDIFSQAVGENNSRLKTNVIILDACRDNPYTKSWSKSLNAQEGLTNIANVPNGTFIGFATQPGKVASAIGTKNSPYTEAILRNIATPNESIDDIFTDVNATTRYLTGGEQTPFKNSSLDSKFYFTYNENLAKSLSTSISLINESANSSNKILAFAQVLPLGISLNDVIVDEYGQTFSGSVKYDDLPVAPECKNKLVKYYWKKLSQSKHFDDIRNYLQSLGLASQVRDESYIVYMFVDNKLSLISIRLFFNQIEFHKKLSESFNISTDRYPSKFSYSNQDYYTFFALEQNMNVSTISIGTKDTEKYCSFYWYGNAGK